MKRKARGMSMQRLSPVVPGIASLLLTLLSGVLLFNIAFRGDLTNTIISVGLDPLRAALITALVLATIAALTGAAVGRRKVAAMVGAGAFFCTSYLVDFIHLELQPAYDPGGHLERLNGNMLIQTACAMLALALLAAFIGSAIGVALGEALLDPPFRLVQLTWRHLTRSSRVHPIQSSPTVPLKETPGHYPSHAKKVTATLGSWLGAITMGLVLVLASSSSDLFFFSPDIGLHTLPLQLIHHKGSTLVQDEVVSPALGGKRKAFLVYLPPSYNTPSGKTKHYPTLYLLHGAPGTYRDWFTGGKADQSADTLIALGKIPELILILPDGNGRPGGASEWGNSFNQRQLIETYVAVDLVKYVDRKYRTIPEAAYRAIGGLSMGGFGAMNIATHHPDLFGSVISLGGYYRAEGNIWGNNASYQRENSPLDMLPIEEQAWRLRMYIGGVPKDQPNSNDPRQFVRELVNLRISYRLGQLNGFHSWKVWQTQIYNALLWLHWG